MASVRRVDVGARDDTGSTIVSAYIFLTRESIVAAGESQYPIRLSTWHQELTKGSERRAEEEQPGPGRLKVPFDCALSLSPLDSHLLESSQTQKSRKMTKTPTRRGSRRVEEAQAGMAIEARSSL